MADGTQAPLTVDSATPAFEAFLSAEENPEPREAPPAQEQDDEPAPDEVEAETEQAETEGEPETPDTDEAEDPEQTEQPIFRVKIDGEEVEVTLDELQKGYSRNGDYTKKTQELAAQRKALEAEQSGDREKRQQLATYLTQLEQAIKQSTPAEPDWAKLQQTAEPAEFAATWASWQAHKQEMDALAKQKQDAQQAVDADHKKAFDAHLETEQTKLVEAIPTWKNPETAKAEKAKLAAYAEKIGFTQEEIGSITDHRPLVLLRKAMLWDAAQAKKPAVQQRIEKVRTATPGPGTGTARKPMSDAVKARLRLAKTGKVDDASAAMENWLPD